MSINASSSAAADTPHTDHGPSGASAAFTSNDPIVKKALALMDAGQFKEAQSLLASDDGHADPKVEEAREEMKEIIRRTRQEFPLTAADLLAKIQNSIPDATAADLERWTKDGKTEYHMVDGEILYYTREPVNLYRFSDEARARKEANQKKDEPDPNAWTLIKHLSNVVAAGETSDTPEVLPIRHRITYVLTVDPNRPGAKAGSIVRCWLPYPQEYRQQKNVTLISASEGAQIAPNGIDGKTIGGAPQRTVYFEKRIEDPSKPVTFTETFEFDSYAYYPKLMDELAQPLPADWGDADLGERLPHIAFTPEMKETVAKIVGDETNPLKKVRKIYYWINANVKYHAEQEYTTLPSFSLSCLSKHKGDCGVQSTLFITMARIAGVPARWQSGWETKRDGDDSMHDWAEVYIAPWGWIPVDQSYGLQKKSDDPKIRDFYIGHQDSYRIIFSLDWGQPLHPPKNSLRSEPADFQRGEVEMDGRNLYFDEWDWDMKIEYLTEEPK